MMCLSKPQSPGGGRFWQKGEDLLLLSRQPSCLGERKQANSSADYPLRENQNNSVFSFTQGFTVFSFLTSLGGRTFFSPQLCSRSSLSCVQKVLARDKRVLCRLHKLISKSEVFQDPVASEILLPGEHRGPIFDHFQQAALARPEIEMQQVSSKIWGPSPLLPVCFAGQVD